jgi:hypothetical protein
MLFKFCPGTGFVCLIKYFVIMAVQSNAKWNTLIALNTQDNIKGNSIH